MKKLFILPFAVFLLSACISPPPGLEKDQFTIQSLKKIEPEDYSCRCKKVRLGGKVLEAKALQGQTRVEVLSLPIAVFSAKPVLDSVSDGRFIAYLNGFVDPEALKNQYITVAGVLKEKETGKVDQVDYQYPVVDAGAYKQWRLVQEYYYEPYDWDDYWYRRHFGFGFFWHRPDLRLRYNLY